MYEYEQPSESKPPLDAWDVIALAGLIVTVITYFGSKKAKAAVAPLGLVTSIAGAVSLFTPKCLHCFTRMQRPRPDSQWECPKCSPWLFSN